MGWGVCVVGGGGMQGGFLGVSMRGRSACVCVLLPGKQVSSVCACDEIVLLPRVVVLLGDPCVTEGKCPNIRLEWVVGDIPPSSLLHAE